MSEAAAPITGFSHIALSVSDCEASARWWATVFGGQRVSSYALPEHGASVIVVRVANIEIELLQMAAPVPRPGGSLPDEIARTLGFAHCAFAVADCDQALASLRRRGARVLWEPETSARSGYRAAHIADPDGNDVELVQTISPSFTG